MSKIYLIYRSKVNGLITKYSILKETPRVLDHSISDFNEKNKDYTVEQTNNEDFKALIELAEAEKIIRESDIKNIVDSMDQLQDKVYQLRDRFREVPNDWA